MDSTKIKAEFLKRHCQQSWSDISVFDTIDSTSNWIKQQAQAALVCLAEQQTAGRGRHGHQWQSPDAENIYLSFSWRFDKQPEHLGLLGLWIGIVLAEVLAAQGVTDHGVKWPNDLYWQRQKMGGILVEASNLSPQLIIGVGLNVNMREGDSIDQPWVGLSEAIESRIDRNQLLVSMLDALYVAMIEFPHVDSTEFLRRWRRWDLIHGKQVSFIDGSQSLTGEACGIDKNGYLKIKRDSGEIKAFGHSISKVRW